MRSPAGVAFTSPTLPATSSRCGPRASVDDPLQDPRFHLRALGRFMDRTGPLGRDAPYSNKKLCIAATDLRLLADMLYGLSLRPDCAFVKYGTYQRDGMYLGRVFLATDAA